MAILESKLQIIRKARGFTQQQLSEVSGVTLRMIQLYEQRQNDINKAQVNVVVSLAHALGCDVEDLLEHYVRNTRNFHRKFFFLWKKFLYLTKL